MLHEPVAYVVASQLRYMGSQYQALGIRFGMTQPRPFADDSRAASSTYCVARPSASVHAGSSADVS